MYTISIVCQFNFISQKAYSIGFGIEGNENNRNSKLTLRISNHSFLRCKKYPQSRK